MEHWKPVPEFPTYSVSNQGRIRNDSTGRIMALLVNQYGVVNVGFFCSGILYKRAVAKLVAKAFLPEPKLSSFDTPINLDGDRCNNQVDNLMWRPRWFAVKYNHQFHNDLRGFKKPIVDLKTGERFETSWDAAIKYGLLDREILVATMNNTYVWPTYQRFRVLEE